MNISKRGSQLVLVAILLVMLSPVWCVARLQVHDKRHQLCKESCSKARLYVNRCSGHGYDSFVSVYNKTVKARVDVQNANNLLQFETYINRPAPSAGNQSKSVLVHIYNEKANRYVCFRPNGKLRMVTPKFLHRRLRRRRPDRLTCRFQEDPVRKSKHHFFMYVADEQHRPNKPRAITFCGNGPAKLLRKPRKRRNLCPTRRHLRRPRSVDREQHRRRHRRPLQPQQPSPRKRHRKRKRRGRKPRCQSVFMKKEMKMDFY